MTWCYDFLMHRAGFVLAGGQSVRMGRDKAFLPFGSGSLIESVAAAVAGAVGHVAVIGDPQKYGGLGFPTYPDFVPGCGPISGLHTALTLKLAEWNLLVACDMPGLTALFLSTILDRSCCLSDPHLACVAPVAPDGDLEPLCAVYHSSCLAVVERALGEKRFKMKVLLAELNTVGLVGLPAPVLTNINTPEEWTDLKRDPRQ
jgi:molybdenum cofactor guanylyltransferase